MKYLNNLLLAFGVTFTLFVLQQRDIGINVQNFNTNSTLNIQTK